MLRRHSIKKVGVGISLVAQWLRFHASNAGGTGSIPGLETKSHIPQLAKLKKKKKKYQCSSVVQSCLIFVTLWTVARQASLYYLND